MHLPEPLHSAAIGNSHVILQMRYIRNIEVIITIFITMHAAADILDSYNFKV